MHALIDENTLQECSACKETKPLKDFRQHKECKTGYTKQCRVCTSEKIKTWYHNNKKRRQQVSNERNRKLKDEMISHFGGKCHDCEQSFVACVYDFHHLDGTTKDMNPSLAISLGEKRRMEELSKCIMLCANCHRIRHFHKRDD